MTAVAFLTGPSHTRLWSPWLHLRADRLAGHSLSSGRSAAPLVVRDGLGCVGCDGPSLSNCHVGSPDAPLSL